MFIHPIDLGKLPVSLRIRYEYTNYWVYFTTNTTITCFLYKQEGHLAKQCKNDVTISNVNVLNDTNSQTNETDHASKIDMAEFPVLGEKLSTDNGDNNHTEKSDFSTKKRVNASKIPPQESLSNLKRSHPTSSISTIIRDDIENSSCSDTTVDQLSDKEENKKAPKHTNKK
ncbi:hypothetical protein ANN_13217 [Periplaneta americana]|uniref:Uncharacterized protein n=1 Tax=Periplaneta americana TaxID=6978 RepID=A0ABQ8TKU1_PERAM|nr:hypothetical protein ANN_13217 [Periplaneta americana]